MIWEVAMEVSTGNAIGDSEADVGDALSKFIPSVRGTTFNATVALTLALGVVILLCIREIFQSKRKFREANARRRHRYNAPQEAILSNVGKSQQRSDLKADCQEISAKPDEAFDSPVLGGIEPGPARLNPVEDTQREDSFPELGAVQDKANGSNCLQPGVSGCAQNHPPTDVLNSECPSAGETNERASASTSPSWWLQECGEGVLLDVLGSLDGTDLARMENTGRWLRNTPAPSLAGIWRFVHVRCMGGRPPATVARSPAGDERCRSGGKWKKWWIWRRQLLAESPEDRRQAAARFAEAILDMDGEVVNFTGAQVQPMMPSEGWKTGLLHRVNIATQADLSQCADVRLAPISQRWHCLVLIAAQAAIADANDFLTDQIQFCVSWSVCFSAFTGRPRLFMAWVRHSASRELRQVEITYCKVPPRTSGASWQAIVGDMISTLDSGRNLSSSLCQAAWLCQLSIHKLGEDAVLQKCHLAPKAELAALQKEILGSCAQGDNQHAKNAGLGWVLAATCPDPFGQDPGMLQTILELIAHELNQR